MPKTETQAIFDSLDQLLDRERQALMGGELEALNAILSEKEVLFDQLAELELQEGGALAVLQDKITRNQLLLDGALDGVRSVIDRMRMLRHLRKTQETYDSQGQRQAIQDEGGDFEKRA